MGFKWRNRLYASADSLKATFEYDFEQEKKFSYKGLNEQETIEHIARFISYLWQIHIFGEGNTRTTAIFLIKYLRTFGFKVDNELFEQHSWYFRNALVRANYKNLAKNIHATNEFLLRFFENLLFGEKNILKNREMHILYIDPEKTVNVPVNVPVNNTEKTILEIIKNKTNITYDEIASIIKRDRKTVQRAINKLKKLGFLERIGSDKTGHWKIIEM